MDSGKPSVLLVHGAWADGSSWNEIIAPLQSKGLDVLAAPIPLTSLSDDVAALERALERSKGPVVLAAHAYAGAVIAAVPNERVQSLVYIAAQRPIAVACIQEKSPRPAWKVKPSWYLVAEEDRMINPATQLFMAKRMGARIRSEKVDHTPLVTAPELVTGMILDAVAGAGV